MRNNTIREKLTSKGLKVTPQRLIVLDTISKMSNHPAADNIVNAIRTNNPNISVGTIYKILDKFVEKGLIKKVKTEKDKMRFDPILEHHHHLYCSNTDRIEDYHDQELDDLLNNFFSKKSISDFKIEDIKLQILGKFKKSKIVRIKHE